jgi:hypothetical protein
MTINVRGRLQPIARHTPPITLPNAQTPVERIDRFNRDGALFVERAGRRNWEVFSGNPGTGIGVIVADHLPTLRDALAFAERTRPATPVFRRRVARRDGETRIFRIQ